MSTPDGVPEMTEEERREAKRKKAAAVLKCVIWSKLMAGELHLVTFENIEELFAVLKPDYENSEIPVEALLELKEVEGLTLMKSDVDALCNDAEKKKEGYIRVSEFYKSLTEESVSYTLLKRTLYEEQREFKLTECDTKDFIDWCKQEYEIKRSLWALPETICLYMAYIIATANHFAVSNGHDMENTLQYQTNFGDMGIWLAFDLNSLYNHFAWGWLPNVFKQNLDQDPVPGRIARDNQIVGGLRYRKTYMDPIACDLSSFYASLYDSINHGLCRKMPTSKPKVDDRFMIYQEQSNIIADRHTKIKTDNWLDVDTKMLQIEYLVWNAQIGTFSHSETQLEFQPNGAMIEREFRDTFFAAPYPELGSAIPDLIFVLLLIKMFYSEVKQLIPAMQKGFSGFKDYVKFWVVVDWITMLGGIIHLAVWFVFCTKVVNDLPAAIHVLPNGLLDSLIVNNQTYLTTDAIEQAVARESIDLALGNLMDVTNMVKTWSRSSRLVALTYIYILMFKFFKCFKANMRLGLVIGTLTGSAVDVSHFGVVFFTIYCSFAWAGQLLFGNTVKGFSSPQDSLFFCWRGWIGQGNIEDFPIPIQILCYIWMMSYQLLVIWLMLSILTGLVFESYWRTRGAAGSPPTLVKQINDAIEDIRQSKGFLDLWYMVCEMEDPVAPAHPQKLVTIKSLRGAFAKDRMTKANAEWLLKRASTWSRDRNPPASLSLSDAIRIIGQNRTTSNKVAELTERLKDLVLQNPNRKNSEMTPKTPATRKADFVTAIANIEPHSPLTPKDDKKAGSLWGESDSEESDGEDGIHKLEVVLRRRCRELNEEFAKFCQERQEIQASLEAEVNDHHEQLLARHAQFGQQLDFLKEVTGTASEGTRKMASRLMNDDLSNLQNLPEQSEELFHLAELSRAAVANGTRGHGADPLKRLEQYTTGLAAQVSEASFQTKDADEFREALKRIDQTLKALPDLSAKSPVAVRSAQLKHSNDSSDSETASQGSPGNH